MLKAVIVEDEKISRDVLSNYIAKYCPDVKVLDTADDIIKGIDCINKHKPDIVFLDIEMPKGNGFDLLEKIGDISFETIFVTAFSNYAIRALNFSAAYYILKPVSIDELIKAVEKVKKLRKEKSNWSPTRVLLENIQTTVKQNKKILLPLLDGFEMAEIKDIAWCSANDNFTAFHFMSGKTMMICRTLKFYQEILDEYDFIRVHKSHMVNKNHIMKYKKGKGGSLTMADGAQLDVSPGYKENLMCLLGK